MKIEQARPSIIDQPSIINDAGQISDVFHLVYRFLSGRNLRSRLSAYVNPNFPKQLGVQFRQSLEFRPNGDISTTLRLQQSYIYVPICMLAGLRPDHWQRHILNTMRFAQPHSLRLWNQNQQPTICDAHRRPMSHNACVFFIACDDRTTFCG